MKMGLFSIRGDSISLYIAKRTRDEYKHIDTITASLDGKTIEDTISGFQGKGVNNIYLSLPLDMLSIRELKFPFSDRKKIDETITFELDGLLLGNVSDYVIDHLITQRGEEGCNVLAVCIEKIRLKEMIDIFSRAGLEPMVITSLGLQQMVWQSHNDIDAYIHGQPYNEDRERDMALNELKKPTINLRRGEFGYRGNIEMIKRTARRVLILGIILLLIYGTGNLARYNRIKRDNSILMKAINGIYLKTFPEEKRLIDPLRQFKGRINQLIKKRDVFGSTSPIEILRDIAELMDNEIRLNEFKYEAGGVIIKGTSKRFETVESFRDRLSSHYDDVKVLDSNLSADNMVNFTIMMKEREG
ncbi:MAG: hypothetical protein Fur0020_11550 [Thermodesulfovibrionia bacterium]